MKTDTIKKFHKLSEQMQEKKEQVAQYTGRMQSIVASLKKEGCKSVRDAQKKAHTLEKEVEELEDEFEKEFGTFLKEYGDLVEL